MAYTVEQLTQGIANAKAAGKMNAVAELEAELGRVQRLQRVESSPAMAAAEAGAPIASPYGMGVVPMPEEVSQYATNVSRYGIPIGTTIALGASGFGLPAAGIGLLAGGGGETIAQFLEMARGDRKKMEPTEIGASAISSGTPLFKFAQGVGVLSPVPLVSWLPHFQVQLEVSLLAVCRRARCSLQLKESWMLLPDLAHLYLLVLLLVLLNAHPLV